MIVNRDITPDRDLYFLGSKVIEVLLVSETDEIDFLELYQKVNKERQLSINLFTLVLDWLFIIGVIKNAHKGYIKKCF